MSGRLMGKVAIISAAAGIGMGQAVARRFAQEGAAIVVTDSHERRVQEAGERLAEEVGREVLAFKVDVRNEDDIRACVQGTLGRHGRIDILYNNAGINKLAPAWEIANEDWALIHDVCLAGAFRFSRAVIPHMIERRSGAIVNVTSIAGWNGDPAGGQAAYAAAKAGIMGLTRTTAAEVGPFGIRVNAIAPGLIYNKFLERIYDKSWFANKAAETPLRRIGTPEDVAGVAVFLVSDDSRFVTGEVLCVSGGRYMHA